MRPYVDQPTKKERLTHEKHYCDGLATLRIALQRGGASRLPPVMCQAFL